MQLSERHCDCKVCHSSRLDGYLTNVCGCHIINCGRRNPPSTCLISLIIIYTNLYDEKFPSLTASEHLNINFFLGYKTSRLELSRISWFPSPHPSQARMARIFMRSIFPRERVSWLELLAPTVIRKYGAMILIYGTPTAGFHPFRILLYRLNFLAYTQTCQWHLTFYPVSLADTLSGWATQVASELACELSFELSWWMYG